MLHLNVPDCIWCFRLPQTNPFGALTTTPAIIFWICFAKVSHFCILRLKVNKLTDLILSNLSEGNFWVMHLSLSSNTSWFLGCCCVFLSCNSSVNNLAVMKFSASSSSVVTRKATLQSHYLFMRRCHTAKEHSGICNWSGECGLASPIHGAKQLSIVYRCYYQQS